MDDMAGLYLFCFSHPDFFESPQYHPAGSEYLAVVRGGLRGDWVIERAGAWYSAMPPGGGLAAQGWKIHLSSVPDRAVETLELALPILDAGRVPFKFAVDEAVLRLMNSATWPRAGASKFLTAYPPQAAFRSVMDALGEALDGLSGPFVLSDRRPGPAPVHYRYGGFRARARLEPSGVHTPVVEAPDGSLHPDARLPYWAPPAWVSDPLEAEAPAPAPVPELAGGRYRIDAVLGTSTRGGVYRAFDRRRGEVVVIKEGRAHVGHDRAGRDAAELRRKEYEILLEIADTGIGPLPIDFFREWEHAFLVEEFVPGIPLGPLTTRSNPLYFLRPPEEYAPYFRWLERIGDRLAEMLDLLHRRGITYGDLSLLNVLVDEEAGGDDPALRLIDFEAARRAGRDAPTGTITPGFTAPAARRRGYCEPADDRFSLGRVLFTSMVLSPCVLDLEPSALDRYLRALTADIGFPASLADRIRRLSPSPAAPEAGAPGADEFATVAGSALDFAVAHLDPSRADRLIPADPAVFVSNPLSVAHGLAGLAHALRIVRGTVPAVVREQLVGRSHSPDRYPPSLYHGLAGIGWVLVDAGEVELGEDLITTAATHPLVEVEPNVLQGAAGVGLALLHAGSVTRRQAHIDRAVVLAEGLLRRRRLRGSLSCWPDPDGSIPIGFAHGSSGIALFFLGLARATGDVRYREAAESAARFDLAQARDVDGRFTAFSRVADGGPTQTLRHYWIDGSAGVGTTAVRMWAATGDSVYRDALGGLIADCSRKYTANGGLFTGLAGMVNFLLDAFVATGDVGLRDRAEEAARGILLFAVRRPEGLAFPGNQGLRLSCDFATGSAGVALALHRVGAPARPNFNFLVDELTPLDVRAGSTPARGAALVG